MAESNKKRKVSDDEALDGTLQAPNKTPPKDIVMGHLGSMESFASGRPGVMLKKIHLLNFGLEVSETGVTADELGAPIQKVTSVVCKFCVYFGRDSRDGIRLKTSPPKVFSEPFRQDMFRQHLLRVHPKHWPQYRDASTDAKKTFFERVKSESTSRSSKSTLHHEHEPGSSAQERSRAREQQIHNLSSASSSSKLNSNPNEFVVKLPQEQNIHNLSSASSSSKLNSNPNEFAVKLPREQTIHNLSSASSSSKMNVNMNELIEAPGALELPLLPPELASWKAKSRANNMSIMRSLVFDKFVSAFGFLAQLSMMLLERKVYPEMYNFDNVIILQISAPTLTDEHITLAKDIEAMAQEKTISQNTSSSSVSSRSSSKKRVARNLFEDLSVSAKDVQERLHQKPKIG